VRAIRNPILTSKARNIIFALYILFVLIITLVVRETLILRIPDHRSVILTPFREWACMFSEHNHLFWFGQITLNILLFIPLGFFLPFQTPKKRISFIRILLVAFLFSVSIEMLQYITGRGITEVDDVINNTFGGVLGWCGQRWICGWMKSRGGVDKE